LKYIRARTADEALHFLLSESGKAQIIAGGTDLMLELKEGKRTPEVLVDVNSASDMKQIAVDGDDLVIGAAATLAEVAASPVVRQYFPSLCKAAGAVGSTQIRNIATLVGNVVTAQPAADAAMALAPLAPVFIVLSASGMRSHTVDELYVDFGRSLIDPAKEVVKELRVPLPAAGDAASFVRLELRKSLSLPMLNVAAMLNCTGGTINWVRIVMGPVGVGPVRAKVAEEFLAGKTLNSENAAKAGELALHDANPRSNPLRGSKEYREQALPVLVRRALEDIAAQLGAN